MSGSIAARAARTYLRAHATWTRLLSALDATFAGVCLGLMGRRALHALDEEMYRSWAEFASEEHNLRGLFDWEERAYAHFLSSRRRIVVMAAGGGRETLALAARGHEVMACECHPDLLRAGTALLGRVAPAARMQFLERDTAPAGVTADAVVVGWSAYTLMVGRETRIALLRDLAQLLPGGGPILLSFFTRRHGSRREPWVAGVAGALRWLRHGPPVELGDDLAPNWQHKFTQAEIEAEIRAAGLIPAAFEPPGWGRSASGWAIAVRPEEVATAT